MKKVSSDNHKVATESNSLRKHAKSKLPLFVCQLITAIEKSNYFKIAWRNKMCNSPFPIIVLCFPSTDSTKTLNNTPIHSTSSSQDIII